MLAKTSRFVSVSTLFLALMALLLALPTASEAQVVAYDMVGSTSQNLLSFTDDPAIPFTSAGDGFNKFQRGVSASIPFAVVDDSAGSFPGDTLGIIKTGNTDEFFGIVDTNNGDTSGRDVIATWVFDISGASDLGLSIDMGAMGDFEAANDFFNWSYSIDGSPAVTAFQSSIDEDASQDYTMEGGAIVTLSDPMLMNGVLLTNNLTPFFTALSGTGSQLTLVLTANTDGGSEAIAFQNLIVSTAVPMAVAYDMVGSTSQNLLSFTDDPAIPFTSAGDGFNKFQRGVSASIPFAVVDDSAGSFPGDTLGIIKTGNTDEFFGIVDTNNGDTSGRDVIATWVFDISGASDLGLSIDMGAMGDFEAANDFFNWSYSIDGSPAVTAFQSSIDEDASQDYTMEGGAIVTLSDPMLMNGVLLTNNLTPFFTALSGTGSQLTLVLTANTDGGSEAIAFQNLVITAGVGPPPPPTVIAFDMVSSASQNLLSFTDDPAIPFTSAGDGFNKFQRGVSASIPFAVVDDSAGSFPGDTLGIIKTGNTDEFFGIVDTNNGDTSGRDVVATWVFDIYGASDLGLSIDMGAMGDFEAANDFFNWSYSIDGGAVQTAFQSSIDEDASQDYTMEGGAIVTLSDPMLVNGDLLNNDMAPFYAPLTGTGSTLTLILTANTDGGSEAIAFQNLMVTSGVEPPPGPPTVEIWEIQGDGLYSPYEGMEVKTTENVVTAVAFRSFYMQTPDADSDDDPYTSDGIYVYTGVDPPMVSIGDRVRVIGRVQEYFELTEITDSPTVDILGGGEPLPTVTPFDATTPSDQPFPVPDLERFEGMLVSFDGIASGPTNRFGEVSLVVDNPRPFREPGIIFPGLSDLPVWDGNPEVFDVDTDGLDGISDPVFAGQAISGYGPLNFTFGRYKVVPKMMSVGPVPDVLRPVRARAAGEFTVGSLNMLRFFDNAEYFGRKAKFVDYILDVLDAPDVLAVQEAEKIEVLEDLAVDIAFEDSSVIYTPILIEGNDVGGIDVGFMVRDTVTIDQITQLGEDEILSYDGSLLHDRPPLLLEGAFELEFGSFSIAVMTVHNRSLGGIDDPSGGERVRQKRYEQAQSIAEKVQALQSANPEVHLVVIGDYNAFEFTDGYVDAVGQIVGDFEPADNLVCDTNPCADLVEPDLTNQTAKLDQAERYSYIFTGNGQALDHALTSEGLDDFLAGLEFGRGNADAFVDLINDDTTPLRSSDHDGLVLFVASDADNDGVPDDVDVCPATVIPESVPTDRLGVNRYALVDEDGVFDTTAPGGRGNQRRLQSGPTDFFTVGDTGGCSCEQIIEAQHLGKGHEKFGCSLGAMRNWVKLVNP